MSRDTSAPHSDVKQETGEGGTNKEGGRHEECRSDNRPRGKTQTHKYMHSWCLASACHPGLAMCTLRLLVHTGSHCGCTNLPFQNTTHNGARAKWELPVQLRHRPGEENSTSRRLEEIRFNSNQIPQNNLLPHTGLDTSKWFPFGGDGKYRIV